MPNHVTNIMTVVGEPSKVEKVFEQIKNAINREDCDGKILIK